MLSITLRREVTTKYILADIENKCKGFDRRSGNYIKKGAAEAAPFPPNTEISRVARVPPGVLLIELIPVGIR